MKLLPMPALALALAAPVFGQPSILTSELPWAAVRTPYRAVIETVADPRCLNGGGLTLAPAEGELPEGLRFQGTELTGKPAAIGIYRFAITASSPCGTVVKKLSLTVTGRPILRVVPEQLVFELRAGDREPKEQTVVLSSTWPSLPFSLLKANNAEWIEYTAQSGATPDPGSALAGDTITIRVKPGKLPAGTHRETLSFSAWQGANAPSLTVVMKLL